MKRCIVNEQSGNNKKAAIVISVIVVVLLVYWYGGGRNNAAKKDFENAQTCYRAAVIEYQRGNFIDSKLYFATAYYCCGKAAKKGHVEARDIVDEWRPLFNGFEPDYFDDVDTNSSKLYKVNLPWWTMQYSW